MAHLSTHRRSTLAAIAATAAATLLVTAGSATAAGRPAVSGTSTAATSAAATTVTTARTSDGSRILLEVPANWNGTLALYSHGYRSPTDSNRAAQDASTRDTADALLARGYALAGSSYPGNGWTVYRGVRADELLLTYVKRHLPGIQRVYVWGDSLGGLITETFAERHPGLISAAAPMCGVLGGANLNLDEALDVTAALRALLLPHLQLRGFHSYADAQATNDQALAASQSGLNSADTATRSRTAAAVLAIAAIADAPRKTQHFDGQGLGSAVGAAVEGIGNALFFGTVGRYDIERRMSGDPSTNVGVDYGKRISASDLRWFESFGFGGSLLRSFAAEVQSFAPRLRPIAAARARFTEVGGNPTGLIGKPTVTMHTEDDPLVLVQNERVFSTRAAAAGRSARLLQLYIKPPASYPSSPGAPFGAGHCVFTTGDRVALIRTLDAWLATGNRPDAERLTALFPADEGLDLGYRPARWPVR